MFSLLLCFNLLAVHADDVAFIVCFADGWAAATGNGGDWVEFQFPDDTGEFQVCQ